MHLLVFGAQGQVGCELRRVPTGALCDGGGYEDLRVIGLSRAEADIARADEVKRSVRDGNCDIVINAAAYTAVDQAENEREAAYAVNSDGAANVAGAAAARGLPVVHLSTDYVFDGTKRGAYRESDPVAPLGVYGMSKEAGERAVRAANERHIILRTSWVFGPSGRNFVKTILRLAEERDEIGVVDDQWSCPTPAGDLAHCLVTLCARLRDPSGPPAWGTYHFCGAGRTTWYGFAREILNRRAQLTGRSPPALRPLTSADYPTVAPRPSNSQLDCSRFVATFGLVPRPWRAGLAEVMRELLA